MGDVSEVVQQGRITYSVTQQINRELGQIINTVGSVEENTGLAGQINNLAQTMMTPEQVTTLVQQEIITEGIPNSTQVQSMINQTAQNITITISQITDLPDGVNNLDTWFDFSGNGLYIGRSSDEIRALYSNNGVEFVDTNNLKLAWLNTDDGLGASQISIGDPSDTSRWQWKQNGAYSWFTRHV